MKRLPFILLLIVLPLVVAQPTDWFSAQSIKTELNVSSQIDISPKGADPLVERLQADVVFIPQSSPFTAVRSFEAFPDSVVAGDRARFVWQRPTQKSLTFGYRAIIETANNAPHVYAKIPFPIEPPRGLEKYLSPTKNIDSTNAAIIGQAYLLAKDEDDLFMAVSKIADWVKQDVDYNLSTLTADVSQPASWVLEHRTGVCDEITSLFIALLRSQKIPARFVSGLAFTNSAQFPQGWGAHGWAEVYFPGVGWVPFDPTFGEYGWVDPGHIKLKESLDPREPTTVYEWKARDVDVKVHDLTLSAQKLEETGRAPFELALTAQAFRPRVGFGSYEGVMLEARNLADYYVSSEFTLANVNDIDIISSPSQQISVAPRGTARAFWIVQVHPGLNSQFQYEIPIRVHDIRNDTASTSFLVGKYDIVFSQSDIQTSIDRSALSKESYDLACTPAQDTVRSEHARIDCLVQNHENKSRTVIVCSADCQEVVAKPLLSSAVSFDITLPAPGMHDVRINASDGSLVKTATLKLIRLDSPRILVKDITLPRAIVFGESFDLGFMLVRDSIAVPQNITITVKSGPVAAELALDSLPTDQQVSISVDSQKFVSSSPTFDIVVKYQDELGTEYQSDSRSSLEVTNLPWYKRIFGWLFGFFG